MEYNVENIRQLAEKYFRGETTLSEEAVLREYFNNSNEVPADLQAYSLLFGQSAKALAGRPRRELILHAETPRKPLQRRRLVAAISGLAAAAAVMTAVFMTIDLTKSQRSDIVCYVNGHLVTDPQAALEYTQEALEIINAKLQKPAGYISPKTESTATMSRVGDMLNALTEENAQ